MFTAPQHQPEGFRRSLLWRIFTGSSLVVSTTLIGVVALGLFVASQILITTPKGLYHRTWETAAQHIFDPSTLGDWQQWEHKYDSQIQTNEDAVKYANEMLKSVKDRYTYLLSPDMVADEQQRNEGNFVGIGIVFDFQTDPKTGEPVLDVKGNPKPRTDDKGHPIVRQVMDGSPAKAGGVQAGDAIAAINGESTTGKSLEDIVKGLRNKAGTKVTLDLVRNGQALPAATLTRAAISMPAVTWKMLPGNVGYIRLNGFDQLDAIEEMEEAMKQLSGASSIVFDMRDNPGGFVHNAIGITSMFVKEGVVVKIKSRIPGDPAAPQYETVTVRVEGDDLVSETERTDKPGKEVEREKRTPYLLNGRPLVVLVNGHSASASEMTAGALKDHGFTVLGEKTFGKGIGQAVLRMPNGTMMHITSLRYLTPSGYWPGDGGNSVSNGIVPTVEVKPDAKNIEHGSERDNQLKAAVDLLLKK